MEVHLTFLLPVAQAAEGDSASSQQGGGLPFSAASPRAAERALLALLLLLSRVYPLAADSEQHSRELIRRSMAALPAGGGNGGPQPLPTSAGSVSGAGGWPGALTSLPIAGGVVVLDLRGAPECRVSWKPLPPIPGDGSSTGSGQLSTGDLAAILYVFAAAAHALALNRAHVLGVDFPPRDVEAAVGIAAAAAGLQAALPSGFAAPSVRKALAQQQQLQPQPQQYQQHQQQKPPADSAAEEVDEDLAASEGVAANYGGLAPSERGQGAKSPNPKTHPRAFLRSLGIKIYDRKSHIAEGIDWDCLAGGEATRREVEEAVLFPMQHPEAYREVCRHTRVRPEGGAAGAYLFVGPPGTGKTTTARIIASQTEKPLIVLR